MNEQAGVAGQVLELIRQLDAPERKQILQTISRPEIRRSLPALNSLYDTIKRRGK